MRACVCEKNSLLCIIDFHDVICVCVCVSLIVKWYPIKDGRAPLGIAALRGHLKVVEYLVTEAKVNPNQSDEVINVICDACDGDENTDAHLYSSLIGDHECREWVSDFQNVICVFLCFSNGMPSRMVSLLFALPPREAISRWSNIW